MKKLALAFITLAAAASSQAVDLKSVFEQAVSNDPQLAAELAAANANTQSVGLARVGILPQVAFKAEQGTSTLDDGANNLDGVESDRTSYSIQLKQAIFGAEAWYSYSAASATTDSALIELRKAEQSLVIRLSEDYFDVLRANSTLAAAKANEAAVKRQLEQTQQRFKVGLIAITDVHEAQAIYDGATVELIAAESQLDIAYETLAVLTGERYDRINPLKEALPLLGPIPADRAHWEQKALAQNLDVLIAQQSQASAKLNHKSKISAHMPTLDLVASYGVSNDEGNALSNGTDLTSKYVGLELNLPIYLGGSQWAGQKQAYYQRQAAERQLELQQRIASLSVRSQFRQLTADMARIKARKQAMTSAKSAMEATQTGYEVGTRNIVEVLKAQQSVFSAQKDYAFSRYDYVIDMLKFRQAVGELSMADIEEVNGWLQN
ncbi:hypothetical protein A9Q73_06025 [Bermanella sp. 47_1433_sub80_T6]|nr:hypothetical protein A9Q73_06025 [Bermanella sp. 47_1433_sub80_T6]